MNFLANLVLFSIPALVGLGFAAALAKRSRDEWRLLAWIPPMPLLLWSVYVAWGTTRDPTSHNLWPFELIIWTALSCVLFATFLLARRLLVRPRQPWQH